MRKLTQAAQIDRELWKDMKCINPNSIVCYCPKCQHPGNPSRQRENPDCWEYEVEPAPPRGRMEDWRQA